MTKLHLQTPVIKETNKLHLIQIETKLEMQKP